MNKIKAFFIKIKNFLCGFLPINREFQLQEEPLNSVETFLLIGEKMDVLFKHLSYLPLHDVVFTLRYYRIRPVDNIPLKKRILYNKESISFKKISMENYYSTTHRQIDVLSTIYSMGIDGRLWEFQFNPMMMYRCSCKDFDNTIIDVCCQYIEFLIDALQLNTMVNYPLSVTPSQEDELSSKSFEGRVVTYGNYEDSMIYGIDKILPNPYENISDYYKQAVHVSSVPELVETDGNIPIVVENTDIRAFKEAMKKFNIDVLSESTVGNIVDVVNQKEETQT
jgi:hypothetical protein